MNKQHKHKDLIIAWANGAEIEILYSTYPDMWKEDSEPTWREDEEYRIKPEKEYPKSTLSYDELCKLVNYAYDKREADGTDEGMYTYLARVVADAAVKKYIQENEE